MRMLELTDGLISVFREAMFRRYAEVNLLSDILKVLRFVLGSLLLTDAAPTLVFSVR